MKNNQDLRKEAKDTICPEPSAVSVKNSVHAKVGKHLKKIILIASVAGAGLFFNACTPTGYISAEPVYLESIRPAQPSSLHIWIDGDWVYSRQTRNYVRQGGYWQQPAPNQVYVSGYWKTSHRGHSWAKGHWKRKNH